MSARWILALALLGACGRPALPSPRAPLVATAMDAIPPEPALAPLPPFELGEVRVHTFPNGLTAIIAPRRWSSVTALLVTRGAAEHDERSYRGLTYVLSHVLLRATETDDGVVRSFLTREGFDPWVRLGTGGLAVGSRFAPARTAELLTALATAVRHPAFPLGDIEQVLDDARTEADTGRTQTERMLERRMATALYAEGDRRTLIGYRGLRTSPESMREHLLIRYRQSFVANQSAVIVAGDVDADATLAAIEASFGDWARTGDAPRIAPPLYRPDRGARALAVGGRSEHVLVVVRERAPPFGHPDYPAFQVISNLLGGMSSARLNLELRRHLGATYGFNAAYRATVTEGELDLATSVAPSAAVHTMRSIVRELARVCGADGGLRDEELQVARTRARSMRVAELDTSRGLADQLGLAFLARLPPSALEDEIRAIERIDAAAVHAAARRWIRPDRAPFIVVGDEGFIAEAVEAAGLGTPDTARLQ